MNPDPPPPGEPDPSAAEPGPERRLPSERRAPADRRQRNVPVEHDRRSGGDRRSGIDRRASAGKRAGEYDLDADTLEFIQAVHRFKEESGKAFPSWSDILGILRALGYEKRA